MEAHMEIPAKVDQANDIENLQHLLAAGREVVGFHEAVLDGPDGVYMCSALGEEALSITFNSITEKKELGLGATDSHHQVGFGEIEFRGTSGERTVQVAVKRYDDELQSAVGEMDALLEVQRRGFDAIGPVAIVKEGTESYLVTLFRPDVASLDNFNWAVRPGEEGFDELVENLKFMATTTALMHARGIFHGDAQPKNFLRSDTGNPVLVDLEFGHTITSSYEELGDAFNGLGDVADSAALIDFKKLWMTLNRQIGNHPNNIFLGDEASVDLLSHM
jgi:hypothetical protein